MLHQNVPKSRLALDQLNFGALAAEREANQLSDLFVPTVTFRNITSNSKKVILLGNRGTGKTAILSMMATQARKNKTIVIKLNPEDYGYEILSQSLKSEKEGMWAKQGAYAAAWKHLIYITAMKAVNANSPGLKTGAAKRIYTYLRDHHANVDVNPIGALISYLKRLEGVKLGKLEASLKARELQRLYRLEDIANLLEDLNNVCANCSVLVLIDELDSGWDGSEDAVAFVAGLFNAGTSISILTPNVRVIMSLRRELYDNIPALYEDAQKIRDTIEMINWPAQQLFAVICQRIRMADPVNLTAVPDAEIWNLIMPTILWERPSFTALLDFTLFRPRELIHLCTQILDTSRNRGGSLPFKTEDIEVALETYAKERFSDIVSEYRFQYPGLGSVLETFRRSKRELTREALELHCLTIMMGETKVAENAAWCRNQDPEELINVLWNIGFLRARFEVSPSSTDSTEDAFVGSYQVGTANIRNVNLFRIHNMFATHLNCV